MVNRPGQMEASSQSEELVSLGHLAELIGVPLDYIKQELTLDPSASDTVTMEELRGRVLKYLDSTVQGA